jgi:hypothetical protein
MGLEIGVCVFVEKKGWLVVIFIEGGKKGGGGGGGPIPILFLDGGGKGRVCLELELELGFFSGMGIVLIAQRRKRADSSLFYFLPPRLAILAVQPTYCVSRPTPATYDVMRV